MKICAKTQPLTTRQRSSDSDVERKENQARLALRKITERTTCSQLLYATGASPPQLRLHSNKQTEANPQTRRRRVDYRNQNRVSNIAKHHHHCHRSLNTNTLPSTSPDCRCPAPKTKLSRGNTTQGCRHRPITRIKGFPRSCTTDQMCAGGVRQQCSDASKKVNDGRSRRHR
jgi:hypothetical protein